MFLLEIKPTNVQEFFNSDEVIQETIQQIMKDFTMFGIQITFSGNISQAYQEISTQLETPISFLLKNDYQKLIAVLYRIDVTEKELMKADEIDENVSISSIIAHKIIVRELKKVLTRRYYKANNT